jgi:hypothetical protein
VGGPGVGGPVVASAGVGGPGKKGPVGLSYIDPIASFTKVK